MFEYVRQQYRLQKLQHNNNNGDDDNNNKNKNKNKNNSDNSNNKNNNNTDDDDDDDKNNNNNDNNKIATTLTIISTSLFQKCDTYKTNDKGDDNKSNACKMTMVIRYFLGCCSVCCL